MTQVDETIENATKPKEPNLKLIIAELQAAYNDTSWYRDRIQRNLDWWSDQWPGMSWDSRKWSKNGSDCLPYQGSWDSRTRICQAIIQDHVSIAKTAFWGAKIQTKSTRPLIYGRQHNVMQKMLEWRVYSHMRSELLRELPLAFGWRFGVGACFLGVTWEQRRNKEEIPVTMQMLAMISKALGNDSVMQIIGSTDPEAEKSLIKFIQALSPICDTDTAKLMIKNLRLSGMGTLPVAMMSVNKPRWMARRPILDVLFPSETSDIQIARFMNDRELVNESELEDRIVTDGYDPDFVEEVLKHKGEFSDWYAPVTRSFRGNRQTSYAAISDSDRDLVELNHFYYRTLHNGAPCIYRTVFNQAVASGTRNVLYAKHGVYDYKHRQYPLILMRRTHTDRPIVTSTGIPEETYTDELNLKVQQDGLSNRAELIHHPPMIVPPTRREAVRQEFGPGAVMTATRPNEIRWFELSPNDNTPILVMQTVQQRLNERYAIKGQEIDPEIKTMRRQEIANDILGEIELALEQTLQLQQQYETDQDVQRVAGTLGPNVPWKFSVKDIQGKYEVSATIDVRMWDEDYAQKKLMMIGQAMQFNQAGTANMSALFKVAMQMIEPDAADLIVEQDQVATQREIQEELDAISSIMAGIDQPFPQHGNHQLRLQTLIGATIQSQNPMMAKRLQNAPDSVEMLKKRAEGFQNQIQQYQNNPQIGRNLTTKAFSGGSNGAGPNTPPTQAGPVSMPTAVPSAM
jgi:hypothetical protein